MSVLRHRSYALGRGCGAACLALGLVMLATSGVAAAPDSEACRTVRMAEPGWSDIAATDALLGEALRRAGYRQTVQILAAPIIFQALAAGRLDVFLGNWMPAQQHFADPPVAARRIERIRANLAHARFTLAVPDYVAAAGVHDIADLARFPDRFARRIYGIEPGAPANENIRRLINLGPDHLEGWQLVESSEFGMRSQLQRQVARHDWIVFLAWEPNPMNAQVSLTYLSGGGGFMGADYGSSTVYTVARAGLSRECPVLARLLRNVSFDTGIETEMMSALTVRHEAGPDAARDALARRPKLMQAWLDGVGP